MVISSIMSFMTTPKNIKIKEYIDSNKEFLIEIIKPFKDQKSSLLLHERNSQSRTEIEYNCNNIIKWVLTKEIAKYHSEFTSEDVIIYLEENIEEFINNEQ